MTAQHFAQDHHAQEAARLAGDLAALTALVEFVHGVAFTITDGKQCHPALDELNGSVCPCREAPHGEGHDVENDDTYEALNAIVGQARDLIDAERTAMPSGTYRATIEIDVAAETPEAAATQAVDSIHSLLDRVEQAHDYVTVAVNGDTHRVGPLPEGVKSRD